MTMIMSTTCTSPFVKDNEQPQYFKNDIRNSPFTAILMELAKEDNCDAMNSDGTESPLTTIIENYDTFNQDSNPTRWDMYDASLINHEGIPQADGKQMNPDTSSHKSKRRKTCQEPEASIPFQYVSAEQQAETYLLETMNNLKRRLSSSQMQLELFTTQLCNDLPSFVTRAINLFSLNSATLYESSPASFYLDQRMFVDQAVSIYFQQLKPNCPGSSEAISDPSINCHLPDQKCQTLPIKSVCSSPLACPNNYMDWMNNDFDDDIRNAMTPHSVSKNAPITVNEAARVLSAVKIRDPAPPKSHTPVSPFKSSGGHHREVRYGIPIPYGPA
mmetsp:Transcript_2287/g.2399  ORF Transcript_2287/g.2399 Transcript_2287/m.2399 type:complete len:330 (-) Transcript_2287:443-1432(-)